MPWSPHETWSNRIETFFSTANKSKQGLHLQILICVQNHQNLHLKFVPWPLLVQVLSTIASYSYQTHHYWNSVFHRSNLVLHLPVQCSLEKPNQIKKQATFNIFKRSIISTWILIIQFKTCKKCLFLACLSRSRLKMFSTCSTPRVYFSMYVSPSDVPSFSLLAAISAKVSRSSISSVA